MLKVLNFKRSILCLLLWLSNLKADWNHEFDQKTQELVSQLPVLQNSNYCQFCDFFRKQRAILLKESTLNEAIFKTDSSKKSMILKKNRGLVLKKRRNNHIHDLYAWEVSYFLGKDRFVLPAFPIEIAQKRVMVQEIESFECGQPKKETLSNVSLETYWKAHLQAYILGFSDLAATNIGVNSQGMIRFFDNEISFVYYNVAQKTEKGFTTGFISQSFDWPQFSKPIDEKIALTLQQLVRSFSTFEQNMRIYLRYRPLTFSNEGLEYRLEKVRSFEYKKGKTFKDFFSWLYPEIGAGLDELTQLVSPIMKKKTGYGTSLFFMCGSIKNYQLTGPQRNAVQKWLNKYIKVE
jgi:hypothetical protein